MANRGVKGAAADRVRGLDCIHLLLNHREEAQRPKYRERITIGQKDASTTMVSRKKYSRPLVNACSPKLNPAILI